MNAAFFAFFGLKKYESALSYFNRVLANNVSTKDEDARIKKGYSYFMVKKFDLAAREFQKYLEQYPHGRHNETAKKWKEMSTKEILYRIEKDRLPDIYDENDVSVEGDAARSNPEAHDTNTYGGGRHYGVSADTDSFEIERISITEI